MTSIQQTIDDYFSGQLSKGEISEELANWLEAKGRYEEAAKMFSQCTYKNSTRKARCFSGMVRCEEYLKKGH